MSTYEDDDDDERRTRTRTRTMRRRRRRRRRKMHCFLRSLHSYQGAIQALLRPTKALLRRY